MNVKKIDRIILEMLEEVKYNSVPIYESVNDDLAKELEKYKKGKKKKDTNDILDTIQLILDFAGFIPGYGDIIDAINAAGYFYRGKQIEGYLSLIAIVPMVGSAIKTSMKGAIQAVGGTIAFRKLLKQAQAGNITGLADFYKMAYESGKLSKVQLSKLADYGDTVANLLVSGKSGISSVEQALKLDPTTLNGIYKQIDEVASTIRNTISTPVRETIQSTSLIAKGVKKVGAKIGKLTTTGLNLATFGGFGIARNLVKKLGVTERELKQLRKAMDVKFIKQVEQSPLLTTSMFKQLKRPSATQSVGELGVPPWLWSKETKDIDAWFTNLKNTDPAKWKEVSNKIANRSVSVNNPYYVKMASNYFQQAANIFSPGAVYTANKGDILPSLLKLNTYRLSNPKNLDIVANEVEDLAEKIGLDPQDDINSIFVSALYLSVMEMVKEYKDYIPTMAGAAAVGVTAADKLGLIDLDGETETPDEKSKIKVSSDLTDIKNDFKTATGTTTERLDILKQKYSEADILRFKQELDID
jgi:hypothetical protein